MRGRDKIRQWPGLMLRIPQGIDRHRRWCAIQTEGLIGPVPFDRADAAKLIRQLRIKLRAITAERNVPNG